MSLRFKRQALAAGSAFALALLSAPVAAYAQVNYDFNLPAGPLADSLRAVGARAGANIAFDPAVVGDRQAPALRGSYSLREALDRVLAGSGLTVRTSGANAFIVEAPNGAAQPAAGDGWEAPSTVAEVVVTAEKRREDVRKVSGSVTAFTGRLLETLGAQGLQDYLTMTPGVTFNGDIPGESRAVIRGISTTTHFDQGQATAGYFINDVPLADPYFAVSIPDIDAFDVDNVVVLRGPQGTLFGSASLGGAINYQAAKPNLSQYQAHVQGTAETIQRGATGASGKLMVNLPLVNDRLAVRGVYVYRDDPGFIDNLGTGEKNANRTLIRGGRFEATWAPTSSTTFNYMFLDQSEDTADLGYENPQTTGELRKWTAFPEYRNFTTLMHTVRIDQDLGFGTLTAIGAYFKKTQDTDQDATLQFNRFLPGIDPVHGPQSAYSKGTSFEARLASRSGRKFEYLVGVMHNDTRENFVDTYSADNATQTVENDWSFLFGPGIGSIAAPDNVIFYGLIPFHGRETAAFGEATYHFNDQLKVTLGGREFVTESENTATSGGFLNLLGTGVLETTLTGSQKETGFTPKASVTWTPNGDLMAYALVSKGFRFGGPNINPSTPGNPIPPSYGSDSLWNYEMGVRSSWFDHRLLLDFTAFYIDWSNIQLRVATPSGLAYGANAGRAKSYGVEGSSTWRITGDLSLQTNLTYIQAALASDFDPGAGQPIIPDGSELPGTARWQVSNIVSYSRDDLPARPQFILTQRYSSDRAEDFVLGVPLGGYDLFDARAAFHLSDNLNLSLYVTNIGDSRAKSAGSFNPYRLAQYYLFQPRTFGITFDYKM